MKIIILGILCSIYQAQYIDEQPEITFQTSTLIESSNSFSNDESQTKFSSMFDLFTIENEILIEKEEWFNFNQNKSLIYWKKMPRSTYILRSEGQCLRQMCSIKLKYNGTISKRKDGCLSFIVETNGHPMGQLWIEEDQEKEGFSQKIQLTNSTLRVEHSLKSNIKNLSIDARILFRNSKIDKITLSNLNLNWKGSCPKDSSKITPFEDILTDQSTSSSNLSELTNDYSNIFITNEIDNQIESTTIKSKSKIRSSHRNVLWILSLISLFCFSIIASSILYGLWSIHSHFSFTLFMRYDYPIQLIYRRSIRSSTRSNNRIGTLAELTNELYNSQENSISTWTIDSIQSTISNTHF